MYPHLFRIGIVEITTFGVMVAIGTVVGLWVFRRELAASRLGACRAIWRRLCSWSWASRR